MDLDQTKFIWLEYLDFMFNTFQVLAKIQK